METFRSLVKSLGGAAKLAAFPEPEEKGTVQQRVWRNSFPPETWPKLIRWAQSCGRVDVDEAHLVKVAIASKAAEQVTSAATAQHEAA